jgi:acyl-CoA reductase-like NAD-dependent aldehyde dehydrogenase
VRPSRPYGELIPSEQPRLSFIERVPAGVVGVIAPFNFPQVLANTPFRGIGDSGTGTRFGGTSNLEAFTDALGHHARRHRALPVLKAAHQAGLRPAPVTARADHPASRRG